MTEPRINDDIQSEIDRLSTDFWVKMAEWDSFLWSFGADELARVEQEFGMFRHNYGMVKVGSDYNFVHIPTYKGKNEHN